ncbi:bifunctional tetrahydrofolate synthase/dihydrofolate synthase [Blochmannia endosymbiont of Camponotus modoc]|uniref:bifunctional tetrahydrofolate synthase/dihydrofolate synthase n=1 Tax=Blochmannia endosymbiont of Camponotus modoc TaxID=2945587 RepID=UPI002023D193|nr:bifunctional tetrahydrofolate synthase/dihydrofolate synthase [Blochmannia endosymbiont of Camponotus modoc]URJ26307.1 bifunctional tetrahydrofolate synthase/dihydrofolate synthase [Blochmannia endosymbiont of Camponotus modoc]
MNKIFHTPTVQSSLGKWLHYIESLSHILIDLNLDRVRKIATDLDLIHPAEYVILVGGTNGKGTTCCLLETILLNNNNTVGLYTSPHLLSYNERIRVCGKELPDSTHIEALSVIESARHHIALTYFEFITLSALYIFKRAKLDLVILEVGLGGRLDATNIVNPDISVITNFAIDHTDFLGINRDMIAQEKSGIFRFKKPAVIGESCFPVIARKMAQYCGAMLFARGRDWNFRVYGNKWIWWGERSNDCRLLHDLPLPIIPIENAATALSVLYWLPFLVDKTAISYGLQVATLPGRFQIVTRRPFAILDVGHNPHAAHYLTQRLSVILLRRTGKVRMVIGMLKNKDIKGTICCLNHLVDIWYCSDLNVPFSASSVELSDCLLNCNVQRFSNILDAWNQAVLDASFDDCILVFGSFHAVSPIMRNIMK